MMQLVKKAVAALFGAAVLVVPISQVQAGPPIATVSLAWNAGDNPGGTQHLLFWGPASGTYTNVIPLAIPYAITNCVVSNLVAGTRYYFVVQETDGVDTSPYSNELMVKTRMNPPKSLTGSAP